MQAALFFVKLSLCRDRKGELSLVAPCFKQDFAIVYILYCKAIFVHPSHLLKTLRHIGQDDKGSRSQIRMLIPSFTIK